MKAKPNILLITCDQLQAFATGCYGNPDVRTPNIDALAASGVRFTHGITNAPVCLAARSVLLSGQHNRTCTGGVGNVSYPSGKVGSYPMPEYPAAGRLHLSDATLPETLRSHGYRTSVIGKWHIYAWPDDIGFDHYVIPRTHHVHSAQLYTEDGGPEFSPDGWSVEYETQRACQFLQEHDDEEPFFLYLNYSPPHPPINDCPEKYLSMYDPAKLSLRDNVDEANAVPSEHQTRVYRWDYRYYELGMPYTQQPMDYSIRDIYSAYYGNTTWLDDNLGHVMRALEESGLRDDTIVVFVSDHGDNLGSHGRCGKSLPYDEALRIPMIYSCPERWQPRVDEDKVASLLDIAPTLLGAAGIESPAHMAGVNVMDEASEACISEITPGNMVVRTTQFTAHAIMGDGLERVAFFDNVNDPYQMQNLAGKAVLSEEQDRLFGLLAEHHETVAVMPKPDYGFK